MNILITSLVFVRCILHIFFQASKQISACCVYFKITYVRVLHCVDRPSNRFQFFIIFVVSLELSVSFYALGHCLLSWPAELTGFNLITAGHHFHNLFLTVSERLWCTVFEKMSTVGGGEDEKSTAEIAGSTIPCYRIYKCPL